MIICHKFVEILFFKQENMENANDMGWDCALKSTMHGTDQRGIVGYGL